MTLARALASTWQAMENCQHDASKADWEIEHARRLEDMAANLLPRGSGIDNGTKIDQHSKPERIILTFGFHHMDENGYYDGWTEHRCIITASLVHGLNIRITGRNRNQIKDYLYDLFDNVLTSEVEWQNATDGTRDGGYRFVR